MPLNRLMAALAVAWCLAAPAPSRALDFPTGVVRIIVPYLPGGSAEAQARFLAAELQKQWGKPVIIENKPGAGTTIWRGIRCDAEGRRPYALSCVHLAHRDAE